jgi:hypothetical protein
MHLKLLCVSPSGTSMSDCRLVVGRTMRRSLLRISELLNGHARRVAMNPRISAFQTSATLLREFRVVQEASTHNI